MKCRMKFGGRAGKSRYWRCEEDHEHTVPEVITEQYVTSARIGSVMIVLEVVPA